MRRAGTFSSYRCPVLLARYVMPRGQFVPGSRYWDMHGFECRCAWGATPRTLRDARYTSTGTLDTSFLSNASTTIDFFRFTDRAENVAIQADGRMVLGGLARNSVDGYGLARIVP